MFDLGEHVGLLSLGIFVIDLFDETAFFQLGQNAVIDEIIGVDFNAFGQLLAHLIDGELDRAPVAVRNLFVDGAIDFVTLF